MFQLYLIRKLHIVKQQILEYTRGKYIILVEKAKNTQFQMERKGLINLPIRYIVDIQDHLRSMLRGGRISILFLESQVLV